MFTVSRYNLKKYLQVLSQGTLTKENGTVQLTIRSAHFYDKTFICLCYKTSCLNEDVNCTEPTPSDSGTYLDLAYWIWLVQSRSSISIVGNPYRRERQRCSY